MRKTKKDKKLRLVAETIVGLQAAKGGLIMEWERSKHDVCPSVNDICEATRP